MKILNYAGVQHLITLIKEKFVQKEVGKGLSSNDYTTDEKDKLNNLKIYNRATETEDGLMSSDFVKKLNKVNINAEQNIINQIKRNGSILSPDSDKSVDILVPIKVSDLTNDSEFQTKSEVQALIQSSNKMTKEIVTELPSSGNDNVIYLKQKEGTEGNIYDEFLWIQNKWEKIGDTSTSVDLSDYYKKSDIQEITNDEINSLLGE